MKTAKWIYIIAFIEGGAVMAYELISSRIIAPYYGASFYTWSGIIGATLISLAIAYYLGQYLLKSKISTITLGLLFSLSAMFMVLMPIVSPFVLYSSFRLGLSLGSALSALIIILPCITLLAASSPILINLSRKDQKNESAESGNIFAISTLGGIVATFTTGFIIIPKMGIMFPLWIMAFVLLTIGMIYSLKSKWAAVIIGVFCFASTIHFIGPQIVFSFTYSLFNTSDESGYVKNKIYHEEGLLGQLAIIDFESDTSKDRCLQINGVSQTCIELSSPHKASYWQYVHTISSLASTYEEESSVLLLGLAGGSLLKELSNLGLKVDVVDLDSRMPTIAKNYFFVDQVDQIQFIEDDARHYIKVTNKKYDLIIFDIANAEVQPSYLYSQEALMESKSKLTENGTLIINFQGFVSHSNLAFQSIGKTIISSGFKDVNVWYNYPTGLSDVLFVAGIYNQRFYRIKKDELNPCCASLAYVLDYIQHPFIEDEVHFTEGLTMRDDKPILDHLNKAGILQWRTGAMINYSREDVKMGRSLYE